MDKDYISVLEAAKIVKMSPSRFANLLREEREQLPVELNYELVNQLGNCHAQRGFSLKINGNWLEKIYDKGFDMVGHFPILMIHRLDWKNFLSNRKKGVMSLYIINLKKHKPASQNLKQSLLPAGNSWKRRGGRYPARKN